MQKHQAQNRQGCKIIKIRSKEQENRPAVLAIPCMSDSLLWALTPKMLPITLIMRHLEMKIELTEVSLTTCLFINNYTVFTWKVSPGRKHDKSSLSIIVASICLGQKYKAKKTFLSRAISKPLFVLSQEVTFLQNNYFIVKTLFNLLFSSSYNQRMKCWKISILKTNETIPSHFLPCYLPLRKWGLTSWW